MTKEKFPTNEQGEQNSAYEKIVNRWKKLIDRESELKIPPRRMGGYILASVLAAGLLMPGAMGNKAEAQGLGGRIANTVFRTGTFEARSSIDRSMNKKIDDLENDYVKKIGELGRMEAESYKEYGPRIRDAKSDSEREHLENEYQADLDKIAQAKIDLKKAYEKEKRNLKMKKEVSSTIFRGVRGY
ncbi:MAG: hypothetical protein WED06_01830 [Candidatus Paceibacterota bacterium]